MECKDMRWGLRCGVDSDVGGRQEGTLAIDTQGVGTPFITPPQHAGLSTLLFSSSLSAALPAALLLLLLVLLLLVLFLFLLFLIPTRTLFIIA